jgi:hypothetical protein
MQKPITFKNKKFIFTLILLSVLLISACIILYFYYKSHSGIEQPVPFSHVTHVSENRIKCIKCHEGAYNNNKPVISPTETCMSCHNRISVNSSSIQYIREHYSAGKVIEWKRVTNFDRYVNFNHLAHVKSGVECNVCHGNISEMNRVKEEVFMDMKFCTSCHARENVKSSCNSCHD